MTMKNQPNRIRTTKYTLAMFLPLNLYHQFTKLNNVFFLTTLVMLCIPSVSPFTPYTYLIAFSGILLVSMVKDAVEDFKRAQVDKSVNERMCIRISGNYFNKSCGEFQRDNTKLEKLKSAHDEILNIAATKSEISGNDEKTGRNSRLIDRENGQQQKINDNSERSGTNIRKIAIKDENTSQYPFSEQQSGKELHKHSNDAIKHSNNANYDIDKTNKSLEQAHRHLSFPEPIISDASSQKGSSAFIKNLSFFPKQMLNTNMHTTGTEYSNYQASLREKQIDNENFNVCSKPFFNSEEQIISGESPLATKNNTNRFSAQSNREERHSIFSSSCEYFLEISDKERNMIYERVRFFNSIQQTYERNDVVIYPTQVATLQKADFVIIRENDEVPADLFLIYSLPNNYKMKDHCFVETSGLDGETNLKRKTHPNFYMPLFSNKNNQTNYQNSSKGYQKRKTSHESQNTAIKTPDFDISIEKKLEDLLFTSIRDKRYTSHKLLLSEIILKLYFLRSLRNLDSFEVHTSGQELNDINIKIGTNEKTSMYSHQQILLKGSIVKQSAVLGMVISVGNETKQSKNQSIKELSNSNFEKKINSNLKLCFVFYFVILSLTGLLGSLFLTKDLPYLYLSENRGATALGLISTNYILFSFLVPISLFVTIEVSRVFMGMFINKDKNFCILTTSSPPNRSSSKRELFTSPVTCFNGKNQQKHSISNNSENCASEISKPVQTNENSQKKFTESTKYNEQLSPKEESESHAKNPSKILQNLDHSQKNDNLYSNAISPHRKLSDAFTLEDKKKLTENNLLEKNVAYHPVNENHKESKESHIFIDVQNDDNSAVRIKKHVQIPVENFRAINRDDLSRKYDPIVIDGDFIGLRSNDSIRNDLKKENFHDNDDDQRNTATSPLFPVLTQEKQPGSDVKNSKFPDCEFKNAKNLNSNIFSQKAISNNTNRIVTKNGCQEKAHMVLLNNKKQSSSGRSTLQSPSGSWLSVQSSQYSEIENIHCICRNTNIVEDLGNVKYVLTDKTGTLTCNDMSLVYIGTYHKIYNVKSFASTVSTFRYSNYFQSANNSNSNTYLARLRSFVRFDQKFSVLNREDTFLLICLGLTVCNSVEIFNNHYEGQSQDEVCILNGLKNVIKIENRTEKVINVDFLGSKLSVEILMTLEFSSSRRRMSIVVKIGERIFLFSKGGDSTIQVRLHNNFKAPKVDEKYSAYRSLMISFKELDNKSEQSSQNENSDVEIAKTSQDQDFCANPCIDGQNIIDSQKSHSDPTNSSEYFHKIQTKSNALQVKKDFQRNLSDEPKSYNASNGFLECKKTPNTNTSVSGNQKVKNLNESTYVQERSHQPEKSKKTDSSKQNKVLEITSEYDSMFRSTLEEKSIYQILREYNNLGLQDHDQETEKLFETIEKNMIYLGSTFVEDRIQKGVKQCIKDLLLAGINVWMVTGDKEESAKSCGMQCGLQLSDEYLQKSRNTNISYQGATNNSNFATKRETRLGRKDIPKSVFEIPSVIQIESNERKSSQESLQRNNTRKYRNPRDPLSSFDEKSNDKIDNYATTFSKGVCCPTKDHSRNNLNKHTNKTGQSYAPTRCFTISADKAIEKLNRKETLPQTAIIYRASPEQKAEIAKLLENVVAVGDGNNDIMMIQESDVGIGIRGKEGTQASLSADISAPCFLALRRLILVHGHYNYARVSKVALNSLYKNLLLIFVQFYYNFFNGYSGRPIFNFFFLNYFNVLFTSFIPLYIIIFDKDKEDTDLLENPKNYSSSKKYFNKGLILMNVFLAITKASILFWLTYFMFRKTDFTDRNGLLGGYGAMNNWFSLIVFLTVFFRQIRMINFFNVFSIVAIFLSISLYFFSVFVIQEFSVETRNSAFHIYSMPVFYIGLLVVFGLIFFLDFVYDVIHSAIIHRNNQKAN